MSVSPFFLGSEVGARILSSANAEPHSVQSPEESTSIFHFETDEFWLNLHHFLYVLGRAEMDSKNATFELAGNAPRDAKRGLSTLTTKEQETWRRAVTFYANGPSREDPISNAPLAKLVESLAHAGNAATLDGVEGDPGVLLVLEQAAPAYRRSWWEGQHGANQLRRDELQKLVDLHGSTILAYITKAYRMDWPAAGFTVHFSGYSNWAGAYSTTLSHILVVSSLDDGNAGTNGLEIIFHESMHQWDDQVNKLLRERAQALQLRIPPGLSHAMIFYTAGEAVHAAIPAHITIGDQGIWSRGLGTLKPALDDAWKPYLDGKGSLDDALTALIKRCNSKP